MKLTALATVIALVPLIAGCSERTPRAAASTDSTTPAAPAVAVESTPVAHAAPIESTAAVPAAAVQPTVALRPERPLVSEFRERFGSMFPHIAIVDSYPTAYHGKSNIVVGRGMTADSIVSFSIAVANEAMTELGVAVGSGTGPWPDFTLQVDSVTPDSVYLTGTSASYRRSVQRAYRWWPTGDFTPRFPRPAGATASPVCGGSLRVDLDARTIAGIWMNQNIEAIKREVGAANVIEGTTEAEGETSKMYTIKLCGHEVRRRWNGVAWSDPAFRTAEGLGIGSTLAAFDTAYGKGEPIGEEGNSVRYWPINGVGHFFVDVPDGCYRLAAHHWVVDRSCRATSISFIVFTQP